VATHQLDEFYPISPVHKNSFTHYVRSLYFPLLGLQDHNILDMDLYKAQVLTDEDLKGTRPHAHVLPDVFRVLTHICIPIAVYARLIGHWQDQMTVTCVCTMCSVS
jgi:hypothetical protein